MLSVQSAGVQANLCLTGVHLPLLAVTFKSLRALCPLPSHLPLLPVPFPLYLLSAPFHLNLHILAVPTHALSRIKL